MLDELVVMGPKNCPEVLPDGRTCGQPVIARGRCSTHYQALYRAEKGIGGKRKTKPIYDASAVYTRVSQRTAMVMAYLLSKAGPGRSRYDLAREWLEERASQEEDPPKEYVERYLEQKSQPQIVGGVSARLSEEEDSE